MRALEDGDAGRQSRDLDAAALQSRAAAVQWSARWVQTLEETRRQSGDGTWDFGSRQEAASAQRGGFNGTTQAFWGCVSPRPTTLRCNDPPPNIQDVPLQTTASQHETRRRHTPRETRLALPPGRFCHGDSATARPPELSLPMLPACVGLDATSSIEPVWWRSPSCSRLPLPPLAASPSLPVLADTPNQPSVAPTRHLAASARRSMTYSLKSSASLDCCARLYCRPTNGAPLFSHRDMRHFSPDLVCHVRRALFARYDHHGSTHRRPRIDRSSGTSGLGTRPQRKTGYRIQLHR